MDRHSRGTVSSALNVFYCHDRQIQIGWGNAGLS
jgi:DUF1365 family protein